MPFLSHLPLLSPEKPGPGPRTRLPGRRSLSRGRPPWGFSSKRYDLRVRILGGCVATFSRAEGSIFVPSLSWQRSASWTLVIRRKNEVERVIQILCRRTKTTRFCSVKQGSERPPSSKGWLKKSRLARCRNCCAINASSARSSLALMVAGTRSNWVAVDPRRPNRSPICANGSNRSMRIDQETRKTLA